MAQSLRKVDSPDEAESAAKILKAVLDIVKSGDGSLQSILTALATGKSSVAEAYSSSNSNNSTTGNSDGSPMAGVWRGPCQGTQSASFRNVYTISNGSYVMEFFYFAGVNDCSTAGVKKRRIQYSASFGPMDGNRVMSLDLTNGTLSHAPVSADEASQYNSFAVCGKTDWAVGVLANITNKKSNGSTCNGQPDDCICMVSGNQGMGTSVSNAYTIVTLDQSGNSFTFGKFSAQQDGSTPAKRSTGVQCPTLTKEPNSLVTQCTPTGGSSGGGGGSSAPSWTTGSPNAAISVIDESQNSFTYRFKLDITGVKENSSLDMQKVSIVAVTGNLMCNGFQYGGSGTSVVKFAPSCNGSGTGKLRLAEGYVTFNNNSPAPAIESSVITFLAGPLTTLNWELSDATSKSVSIEWDKASSTATGTADDMQYKIVRSTSSADIDTAQELVNATTSGNIVVVKDFATSVTYSNWKYKFSDLDRTANTTYHYGIVVRDPANTSNVYAPAPKSNISNKTMFQTSLLYASSAGSTAAALAAFDSACASDAGNPDVATSRANDKRVTYKALVGESANRKPTGNDWVLAASTTYRSLRGTVLTTTDVNKTFSFMNGGSSILGNSTDGSLYVGGNNSRVSYFGFDANWNIARNCTNWTTEYSLSNSTCNSDNSTCRASTLQGKYSSTVSPVESDIGSNCYLTASNGPSSYFGGYVTCVEQ